VCGRLDPSEEPAGTHRLGLAFRRLRIRDLGPEAGQPMASPDGRLWIALNGEVYNFQDLRRELERYGTRFRTRGDTEVALAAYERWGPGCFERFNGMWALLIVDLRRRVLVGSRDRLGVKPLFFALEPGRLLLASEPKAIAAVQRGGPRIDAESFGEFLQGLPPQSPDRSFFAGVRAVPAASLFEVDLSQGPGPELRFQTYWDLRACVAEPGGSLTFEAARDELRGLLRSAVAGQVSADVRVGTLLSGGLDSTTLTCLAAVEGNGSPAAAFSIVYDDPEADESRYIDAVLSGVSLEAHRVRLTTAEAWTLADRVVEAQGQPLLGFELLAQYSVYRLAREQGAAVVLDGQGSDEIFGGYTFYEAVVLREHLARGRWAAFARELAQVARESGRTPVRVLRSHVLGPWKRRAQELWTPRPHPWLRLERTGAGPPNREEGTDPSALNRLLLDQTRRTNLPAVLQLQDRSSMAHGVESRVPFLDHHIVELAFRLPASYKIAGGVRKRVLREAVRPFIPAAVLSRHDRKGLLASARWLPLREHPHTLREALGSVRLLELPWLRPAPMKRFLEDYLAGRHEEGSAVWRLYTASRWLDAFHPAP
jgi:asparagine synthase (glutamine-hydrolysing)